MKLILLWQLEKVKEEYEKQTTVAVAKAMKEGNETIKGLEQRLHLLEAHFDDRSINFHPLLLPLFSSLPLISSPRFPIPLYLCPPLLFSSLPPLPLPLHSLPPLFRLIIIDH